jgi:hypothetical protein
MERFSNGRASARNRSLKTLGDVVGVNMMHSFKAEIWQNQFFAMRKTSEYFGVKMSRRVKWFPAGPDNMSGVQNCCRQSAQARFA